MIARTCVQRQRLSYDVDENDFWTCFEASGVWAATRSFLTQTGGGVGKKQLLFIDEPSDAEEARA